jgi:hypothetical protein
MGKKRKNKKLVNHPTPALLDNLSLQEKQPFITRGILGQNNLWLLSLHA